MSDTSFQITVDCADPDAMARFWAEALRYELQGPPPPHATWRDYWIAAGHDPDDDFDDGVRGEWTLQLGAITRSEKIAEPEPTHERG